MCLARASERVKDLSHSVVVVLDVSAAVTGDGVVVVVVVVAEEEGGGGWKTNQEECNKMASPSYDFSYELSTHTHSHVPFLFYYNHPIRMHTLLV